MRLRYSSSRIISGAIGPLAVLLSGLNSPASSKNGIRHHWCSLPFSSFDPFFKAPQHRVSPDSVFHPCPSGPEGFFVLFRLLLRSHCRQVFFTHFLFLLSPSSCVPWLQRSLLAFGLVGSFLRPLQLACATTDALTPAPVRFFGRSSRHELRSLTHGRSPMFVAYHFDPHSTTNHPTSPSSVPLPCSVSPTGSALLRTWLRSSLAVSPTCLAESCSLALRTGCLALGCSRPCLAASPLLCASCSLTV